jgi:signal transduction histidine kinase
LSVFFKKLYVRIWLAVVMAVAVATFSVGWISRNLTEPRIRDVVVRNESGEVIGRGNIRPRHMSSADEPDQAENKAEQGTPLFGPHGQYGFGPEFLVHLADGQTLHMHLPRPPQSPWNRFFWMVALVAVAVALATYPISRKITRRLERLQNGVEKWGEGDLSIRVPESGQDEVAFLAARFNHAAQRIETLVHSHEALLASQKSLLANASHELRSPLTRIRMGLELMGDAAPLNPSWRDEISRNITELDQLIEEILLASRLDAREVDLGTIESVDLIALAAEECARVDADLDVQLGQMSALPVQGVTKLLRRAMRNLLENARRHGTGGITVTLTKTEHHALVRVSDQGPGVPPELRERIFEPFYRLPGATERDGGVGLGLALVKSIVLRHGGRVHCENAPAGGACFEVELPLGSGL